MQPRISMITLGVRDLATSIKFYEDGLGFPRMDSPPEVAFFTLNGTWLGLYGRDALADDATGSPDGIDFPGFALAHNVSSESKVNRIINEAVAAGATLVKSCQNFFGVDTLVTSKIPMDIFGRLRTIHISGLVPPKPTHNTTLNRSGGPGAF